MTKLVVACGTSIEDATGPTSWIDRLRERLSTGYDVQDRSLGGGTYLFPQNSGGDSIPSHISATITEFCSVSSKLMIMGAPMNDLFGLDANGVKTQLTTAVAAAANSLKTAGWTIIGMSAWPMHGGTAVIPENYMPALIERRQAYNDWAVTYFGTQYVDLSWNLRETRDYSRADYRFYLDGLHINEFGAWLAAHTFPLEKLG